MRLGLGIGIMHVVTRMRINLMGPNVDQIGRLMGAMIRKSESFCPNDVACRNG